MKSVIIGIHGLGNKPSEEILEKWWRASILEGLRKSGRTGLEVPFDLVYWADVIHPVPLDPDISDKDDPLYLDERYTPGGLIQKEEPSSFLKEFINYIGVQMDRIFLNDDMTINFKNVTDKLIHLYFSDLETYYSENCIPAVDQDCSAREAIQKRLFQKLEQYRGYRILLIAHSMGSIVAYDVLSSLSGPCCIHSFITLGSPLGLPIVVGRIPADRRKKGMENLLPSVPESITGSWINISDYRDRIALDHSLSDDYSENSRGLKARDVYVFNDYEMNGKANPHKSFGYLRTPEVAEAIIKFTEEGRGRFHKGYLYLADRISTGIKAISGAFRSIGN